MQFQPELTKTEKFGFFSLLHSYFIAFYDALANLLNSEIRCLSIGRKKSICSRIQNAVLDNFRLSAQFVILISHSSFSKEFMASTLEERFS